MPLFTEMHKREELRILGKRENINIKGNFKTCVAKIRGKEDAGKKKKKPSLMRLPRIVLDHAPILFNSKEDSLGPKTFYI